MTNSEFLTWRELSCDFSNVSFHSGKLSRTPSFRMMTSSLWGTTTLNAKNTFRKIMDFPGKHLEMKMLTREGAAVQTFFFKNVTFLTLVTRNNKRSTSTDFFLGKKSGIFYWKTWNFFWPISLHILSVLGKVFEGKYRLGKCEECEIVTCCDIETYCLVFTVFLKRFLSNVTNWLVFLQKFVENWI